MVADIVLRSVHQYGSIDDLRIEVRPDLENDLCTELDATGVEYEPVIEHSAELAAVVLVVYGVLQADGIGQIARVVEAVAHRHDGKNIRLRFGDEEFEIAGDTHARMLKKLGRVRDEWRRNNPDGEAPASAEE